MNEQIPLGQSESERREFKGKDVLRHLPNVSREVVAMLNAAGGEIWIGLAEEQGRAVRLEAIENAGREVNRLRDHFSDAIEPSPTSSEVAVESVACKDNGMVLKVRVTPIPERRPYALREGTARHFIKRVHDRLRPMSREEIFHATAQPDRARETALRKIREARERQRDKEVFWLRIQPVGDAALPLSADYREYFTNPLSTENRVSGWNFVDPSAEFKRKPDLIRNGREGEICVKVFGDDGAVEFTMPIVNLYWKTTGWLGNAQANEIWPYALLEYPVSIFRLARTIYRERQFQVETVLADLALFGIKGWTLRPHSPVSFGYKLARPQPFDRQEIVSAEPLSFSFEAVVNEPDRCAFRLVQTVYKAFELFEEDMPADLNRDTGRLILPGA